MAVADDFFGPACIDVDEWRDEPVRYRYVHGGFEGTDTRFSFYFPPAEQWQGRFIHFLQGGEGGDEATALGSGAMTASIPFAVQSGSYLVESNQGHLGADLSGSKGDPAIIAYRASAESARYSRQVAEEMYGTAPHHGYVYGGSGGGIRSINCIENVDDVWSGAVSFIMPHPTQGEFFSIQLNALRLLGPKMADVIAATEVGGSGNPFEGLSAEQADVLAELYRAGFPRGGEFVMANPFEPQLVWTWQAFHLAQRDPTYYHDFWNEPGYEGYDNPGALAPDLVEFKTTVKQVVEAGEIKARFLAPELGGRGAAAMIPSRKAVSEPHTPIGVIIDAEIDDPDRMVGVALRITNGKAAGRLLYCLGAVGGVLVGSASGEAGNLLFSDVEPGDEIVVDNREFLAFCHLHRHAIPVDTEGRRFPEWDQFLVDGRPKYRQRDFLPTQNSSIGRAYTWDYGNRKMIICQNTNDIGTWPCGGHSYATRIRERLGDGTDAQFRLWWTENAAHGQGSMFPPGTAPVMSTRLLDYDGILQQALLDLMGWVEDGKEPLPSSAYEWSRDGKLTLAPDAADRHGLQPVVQATVASAKVASAPAGTPLTFEVTADMPPGAGTFIAAEWDWDGTGAYPFRHEGLDGTADHIELTATHTFDAPGTYYPSVRVYGHRHGDVGATLVRLNNLDRVRVDIT
jgi:hypothetical protein